MRKEHGMPDREEMETRLARTMRWDEKTMVPTPEQDAQDDAEEAAPDHGKRGDGE